MPRKPRIDYPGLLYHIIVRGIEKRQIFLDEKDRWDFIGRVKKTIKENNAQCLGWALMPNHAHLIIRSGETGISVPMRSLLTGYAVRFNIRYKRVGHLFQNRYKSVICEEDAYLLDLVRYIHLNPIRGGIVKNLEELDKYSWSGHSVIMGKSSNDWQEVDEILSYFGDTKSKSREKYREFVKAGIKQERKKDLANNGLIKSMGGRGKVIETMKSGKKQTDDRILGSEDFVASILEKAEKKVETGIKLKKESINELAKKIAKMVGINSKDIFSKSRERKISKGKAIFIYIGTEYLNQSLTDMANITKMELGSASEAKRRGKTISESENILERLKIT